MLISKDENENFKGLSLPDLVALASPEPELPTLHLDLSCDPLEDNQNIAEPVASIHLDPLLIGTEGHYRVSPLGPALDLFDSMNNSGMNSNMPVGSLNNYNGYGHESTYASPHTMNQMEQKPCVRIVEQPKSNSLRFRYQCEGRGAGALQGANSTPELKTYPKIKIEGYKGPAVVVVSCVAHEGEKPRAHPHNLVSPAAVGREGCKRGVCTMNVPYIPNQNEDMTVEFQHLGIQCVRRRDVGDALKQREQIRVDPYRQGFDHMNSPQAVDLNAVRLCFQVFLESSNSPGKYTVVLPPVMSKPIFDAKAKKTLQIMDISETSAPAEGGKKIIILCERVARDDIKVRFYDPEDSWESWGDFNAADVHKQYAITFKSPSYAMKEGTESKKVLVELVKPSDESTSEPMEFFFLPRGQTAAPPASQEKPRQEQKPPQQLYRPMGRWIKEEKADANNEWGLPPANHFDQDRQSCYQNIQQTSHPYIPNVPNHPYPQQQAYPHHQGGNYVQHNLHGQDGRSPRQVHQPELCGFQGDLNEKNQSQMDGQSHVGNIYVSQPSPDSERFRDMKIQSPTSNSQQPEADEDVEQLSGKIDSISLSGVIGLSLDMQQQQHNLFGQVEEEKKASSKRGAKTAALESGSLVVPPVQGRFIETPEVSGQLNTPDMSTNLTGSGYPLQNCAKVNFLG